MKDGKRAREQKKGSSTAAALSTATEEMKSAAAKEAKELKHLVMDSLKKQNGREATSTGTDMSEADEQELRALNALNVDMHQLVKSLEKTSEMIASLRGNGTSLVTIFAQCEKKIHPNSRPLVTKTPVQDSEIFSPPNE